MQVEVLFQGYPGRFAQGYLAWPTVVYVEHKGTRLLMDAGVATQRAHLPKHLAALDTAPDEIDYVVLSHMHFDHVQNFDFFTRAKFILHRAEYNHIRRNTGDWAYQPYIMDAIEATGRLELVDKDEELLPGIEMLHSPGHTPGCLALILREQGGPVTALSADAIKDISELAELKIPMTTDGEAAVNSARRIRDRADIVIPGHDRTLRVLPDSIEAVNGLELDLIRVPGVTGGPERVPLGFGPSSLARVN